MNFAFSSNGNGMTIRSGNQTIQMNSLNGMNVSYNNVQVNMGPQGICIQNGNNFIQVGGPNGIQMSQNGNNSNYNIKINCNNEQQYSNINFQNNQFFGMPDNSQYFQEYSDEEEYVDNQCYSHNNMNSGEFYDENEDEEMENQSMEYQEDEYVEESEQQGLTEEQIEMLPISIYQGRTLYDKNKKQICSGDTSKRTCAICLQEYKKGEIILSLPCIHRFHKQCISDWLVNQASCPLCKFQLLRDAE